LLQKEQKENTLVSGSGWIVNMKVCGELTIDPNRRFLVLSQPKMIKNDESKQARRHFFINIKHLIVLRWGKSSPQRGKSSPERPKSSLDCGFWFRFQQ
jgi:hypothetical protein